MVIIKGVNTQYCVNIPTGAMKGTTKIIMTFKNRVNGELLFTREYTSEGKNYDVITAEEAELVQNNAMYDFDKILIDGRRFRMHCPGRIQIQYGIGGTSDE